MQIQIDDYEYLERKRLVRFEGTDNQNLVDIDIQGQRATISVADLYAVAIAYMKLREKTNDQL